MKKLLFCVLFAVMSFLSFAFPNMKLYLDSEIAFEINEDKILDKEGKVSMIIRDGNLYETENSMCVGTISEDK